MKGGLTIHSMVKNEPLLYYSIKSVYPYVDKILITDTGSTDHTLEDIETLLKEDKEGKITFNSYPIEADGHTWNVRQFKSYKREYAKTVPLGPVRQSQIDATETDFFMVLDGDEVHYRESMEIIHKLEFPSHINHYRIPLIWLYDWTHFFISYSLTGRLFRTSQIKMKDIYWPEMHQRLDNSPFKPEDEDVSILNIKPYTHFETVLRPHRRAGKIPRKDIQPLEMPLPEVFQKNRFYKKRFITKGKVTQAKNKDMRNLYNEVSKYDSILEIGCGEGRNLTRTACLTKVGIDAFRPILDLYNKDDGIIRLNYNLQGGLTNLILPNTFDSVMLIDIIEHFEKDFAFELLKQVEQVARHIIVAFVPVGNHPQTTDDRGLGNDFFQTHRSTWYPEDFEELGYEVVHIKNHHNQPGKDSGAMFCIKRLTHE